MNDEKTFKASNGITITISDEGYLTGKGGNEESVLHATGGAEYGVQALREFFQHERDQQLGRVRWPAEPRNTSDAAAHWYFTEGPGKPEREWEQAEPGEVWWLTVDGEEGTFLAGKSVAGTPYFYGQTASPDADDTGITAGRKLLNADGSMADD